MKPFSYTCVLSALLFLSLPVWGQNQTSPGKTITPTPTCTSTPADTPTPPPLYPDYTSAYNAGVQDANDKSWKNSLAAFQAALNYATSLQTRDDCQKGIDEAKAQLKNLPPAPAQTSAPTPTLTPAPVENPVFSPLTGLRLALYYYKLHNLKKALSELRAAKPKSLSQKACRYFILYRVYTKKAQVALKQGSKNHFQREQDKALGYKAECQKLITGKGSGQAVGPGRIDSIQKSIDPVKTFLDCCDEGKGNCGDIPWDI